MKIVLLTVCFSCVKAIDEQEVLSAFVDVYDKMYEIRDDHAKQIKQLNNKDLEKTKQIESLKLQLEEMKKMIAPATCSELWNQAKIFIKYRKHGSSSFSHTLELVSKELNHFGVIAGLFRQIEGHSSRFVLFCSF